MNLPQFSQKRMMIRLFDMMLPVLEIRESYMQAPKMYFLFSDVLHAVTHSHTQMTGEVSELELKAMNLDNRVNLKMEKIRVKRIKKLAEKYPSITHLEYSSAHLAFVKILTQMIRKRKKQ